MHERISAEEFFTRVARDLALRSTCIRGQVGAVAVQDRRIVATGFNGAPPGAGHCLDLGCEVPDEDRGCQRAIHAEANLVAWAARHGVALQGATVYGTHSPCRRCAQLLVQAGIEGLVFEKDYRLGRPDILWDAHILTRRPTDPEGQWTYDGRLARQDPQR